MCTGSCALFSNCADDESFVVTGIFAIAHDDDGALFTKEKNLVGNVS